MTKFILALDQGTTSSRAIVFDRRGRIVATAQQEFRQIFPQPGWVEHDAGEIWSTQLQCAQSALRQAGAKAHDVAAIGVTNQRETTVIWDRATGTPIANAIVWQDRRTAERCRELREQGVEPRVTEQTGLVLDPYFSATKIEWLLDHVPGARARAARGELAFGTIDTWLIWNLTGGAEHVTDVSNASRTLLLDLHSLEWSDELLELFNVPRAVLPRVTASSEVIGTTVPQLFGEPIAIAGNAGDQQAATFGQACFGVGMAKNTIGTGAFMLMNVGARPQASHNRLLATVGWKLSHAGEHVVHARRQRLRSGCGGAVAARWARAVCAFRRCRSAGAAGRRSWRRVSGPRVCRTRCAALGCGGTRRDRWIDARNVQGAHRARRTAIDRFSIGRCAGSDAARCAAAVDRSPGRWRRGKE